jgi:hypothetical protein
MSSIHSRPDRSSPLFPCVHWMQFLAATRGKSTSWFAAISARGKPVKLKGKMW